MYVLNLGVKGWRAKQTSHLNQGWRFECVFGLFVCLFFGQIGLAVGDIESIQKEAAVQRHSVQVGESDQHWLSIQCSFSLKEVFYHNSAVSRFLIGWCAMINKSPHNGADVINSCLLALTFKYCGTNVLLTHSAASTTFWPCDDVNRDK